jgi:hypothetical protein
LEEVLQSLVLAPLGGLYAICQKAGDLLGQLAGPLIDQTAAYLSNILSIADIAEGEFAGEGKRANIVTLVQKCWERACPEFQYDPKLEASFFIVPATEAGSALAAEVSAKIPMIKTLHALGQTSDVMVCREQTNIPSNDLKEMLHLCHDAYVELSSRPSTSPHSRFDILEWMPLDL